MDDTHTNSVLLEDGANNNYKNGNGVIKHRTGDVTKSNGLTNGHTNGVVSNGLGDDGKALQANAGLTPASKLLDKSVRVPYTPELLWPDLFAQLFVHGGALYGIYLAIVSAKFLTVLWVIFMIYASGFGITAGVHRLWSHKAYKAKLPLRIILAFLFTISGQRHIYAWALDHRVHHKYSETDADPHDARRGFWYSHVGWLVLTSHPQVEEKRKAVDMSDLLADPVVYYQKLFYIPLFAVLCIGLPVLVPWYFWGETLWNSFFLGFNTRFSTTLNIAFSVNSFAHMYGQKPFDKNISPVENLLVSMSALGEGWHNYHHVFPWDYKTSELGKYYTNFTTGFIDLFARIGWAYDLKTASPQVIAQRAAKYGDGTYTPDY